MYKRCWTAWFLGHFVLHVATCFETDEQALLQVSAGTEQRRGSPLQDRLNRSQKIAITFRENHTSTDTVAVPYLFQMRSIVLSSQESNGYIEWISIWLGVMTSLLFLPKPSPPKDMHEAVDTFEVDVGRGELDVYTCIALKCAVRPEDPVFRHWMIPLCIVMQNVIPFLLAYDQWTRKYPRGLHTTELKVMCALLLCYTMSRFHDNMLDLPRWHLLSMTLDRKVPWSVTFWLLWGESVNAIVGVLLSCVLYSLLLHSQSAADLMMAAVAVNFALDFDNAIVDDDMQKQGVEDMKQVAMICFDKHGDHTWPPLPVPAIRYYIKRMTMTTTSGVRTSLAYMAAMYVFLLVTSL